MSWFIYKHTNLINGKVYIGQTKQDPNDRWHNGRGYDHNIYFSYAIKKYGWNNFLHEIIEKDIDCLTLANEREIYWIEFYHSYVGDVDCNGYNLTKGGDNHEHLGIPIFQINIDTLEIENVFPTMREAEKETGIDHSMIGRCCRQKDNSISAGNYYWCYKDDYDSKWKPKSRKDRKDSPLGKAVYQIDMFTLSIVGKYISTKDAERSILNGWSSGISQCCNRIRYSEGGFFWCYSSKWNENWKPISNGNLRSVIRISTTNFNDCKQYDTIIDAANDNKIKNSEIISRCCKRKQISAGGYYWCYKEDYDEFWEPRNDNNRRKIICVETKQIYDSISDAVLATNGSKNIGRACKDSGLTSGGYHWSYFDAWNEKEWNARNRKEGNRRKIVCVETKEVFSSVSDASKKYRVDSSSICKCCKDFSKTSAGYHWCYLENINEFVFLPKKIGKHGMLKVMCVEKNIIYDSLMDAMRDTGIDSTSISRACRGIQKQAGGFHWKYFDK